MSSPTDTSVKETFFVASFTKFSDVISYNVTITSRHAKVPVKVLATNSGIVNVENLTGSTLYYVSVKRENSAGEVGKDSSPTSVHTLPGAPSIILIQPLSTSVYIGFQLRNYARVSEWAIQYREVGAVAVPTIVTTSSAPYFQFWLSNIEPDTQYEIRARVSQLYGTNTSSETAISSWQIFATEGQ
ncbi:uncharacterized protein LOC120346708 isoform X2 [Styela clava]